MFEKYQKQNFCEQRSLEISQDLNRIFKRRRTIRQFSSVRPDQKIIENALEIAHSAPSGANKQPWSFVLASNDQLKKELRILAEREEYKFYHERPNENWINDLKYLGTDDQKEFITECPYLIVIFYKHCVKEDGKKVSTNYYAKESAGIAAGMLLSALHLSGLSVLTYTPSRMQFLTKFFSRPEEEKPFIVLGVGLPKEDAEVPTLTKKSITNVMTTYF